MTKQVTKAPKAPATPAAVKAPARKRPAAYTEAGRITIVTGDGQRRTVRNLSCDRAMQHMKANPTVGKYRDAFAAEIDKLNKAKAGSGDLPGRGGQPATTQAIAILRFLEREGAVTVR